MKLTQQDNIHMGLGRTDKKGMTAYEIKTIRNSLGLTREGLSDMLGCEMALVRSYENATDDDGHKISKQHAEHIRLVAQMPIKRRNRFIKISGYTLQSTAKF